MQSYYLVYNDWTKRTGSTKWYYLIQNIHSLTFLQYNHGHISYLLQHFSKTLDANNSTLFMYSKEYNGVSSVETFPSQWFLQSNEEIEKVKGGRISGEYGACSNTCGSTRQTSLEEMHDRVSHPPLLYISGFQQQFWALEDHVIYWTSVSILARKIPLMFHSTQ